MEIDHPAPEGKPETVSPDARLRQILPAPIEITKFWKSRRRDIAVVVALGPYKEHNLISVREYVVGSDGTMRPSVRGVSLVVRRLPELAAALGRALKQAKDLGLLPERGASDDCAPPS
jgi:Transcriptional Coactivator p15 (PC4)